MQEAIKVIKEVARKIDIFNDDDMKEALRCCVGTKFSARWDDLVVNLAL
jgi:T-complex protein 1 subunit gamma